MDLCRAIGLCLRNVLFLSAWLGTCNVDTIIYHNSPLPTSPKGGVLYAAEGIAGIKG